MLILPQTVFIKWNGFTKQYYIDKGYEFTKINDEFEVNVEDLIKGSDCNVKVLCDYCLEEGKETIINMHYNNYNKHLNKDIIKKISCVDCKGKKTKESNMVIYGVESTNNIESVKIKKKNTNLEKYGVEYATQNKDVMEKMKNTLLSRYGVINYSQTNDYKEKIKKTSLIKYGCDNFNQSDIIKNKRKETNLLRYGYENPMQNKEISDKVINTNLVKYGVEHVLQNINIQEKVKNTMLERYGVINYFQAEECKEKIKNTNMLKYGKEYYTQTEEYKQKCQSTNLAKYGFAFYSMTAEYKDKFKQTSLKNWGTEHPFQNKIVLEKFINTINSNGICNTSSQQLYICNELLNKGFCVESNYIVSFCILDIALFINNINIDIEYDGWYWHQDQQRDRRRDEFLKSQGWKILRIKSGHKIPSFEQIQEGIFKLVNTDRTYTQIVLDDWKENVV